MLVAAACGDDDDDGTTGQEGSEEDGGGENSASDTGVTADTIKVAIVASDLSGLVKAGVIRGVPEAAADINALRISYYLDKWNAEGGINGRTFEYETITWDPADPTSFDKTCSEVTLDYQPFLVVNTGGGYTPDKIPCITQDGDTFFVGLDPVSKTIFEASGVNLITMAAPSEINAVAAVGALEEEGKLLPKSAKIAVLRGDNQFQLDAWDAMEPALEEAGYTNLVYTDAQRVANLPAADAARNVVLSVEAIRNSGATHVLNMLPFTNYIPFPTEAEKAGLDLQYITVDISSGGCIAFTASQASPPLDGTPCVTSWDNFRIDDKGAIKKDSEFEAQCRTEYEAAYQGKTFPGWQLTKTVPGVPWPGLSDAQGVRLDADQPYFECTMMHVLKTGLENAGSDLTHESLAEALYAIDSFDVAGASNGEGSFAENKPFVATALQFVTLSYHGFTDPKDAAGLYGGKCPSPLSCWRTSTTAGWTEITATLDDIGN
jgi:hypothetical protein